MFLGVLVAAYQPLVGIASAKILRRFKIATVAALAVFGFSLVSVVVDASWLIAAGGHCFYVTTLVLFFVQLAALAGIALYATLGVLLKG